MTDLLMQPRAQAPAEDRTAELLRFLCSASRGGSNRHRILELLSERPRNIQEVARDLALNYGTVTSHVRTLVAVGLVTPLTGGRYARGYAVTPFTRRCLQAMPVREGLARRT